MSPCSAGTLSSCIHGHSFQDHFRKIEIKLQRQHMCPAKGNTDLLKKEMLLARDDIDACLHNF